ncbi:putative aspartyl protease [Sphingopyxis panaciterrae]|uniref:hypothetical protein n=1 Tax=Sphingopyxis panaciterrae TaxID=363841 RepID=UPI001422293A|nr:hypothetical protein [Sphingopyxis panaciterrae]NIJ36273.1 putative aspartyl protease [Sphingopyxis panaciterrae]
MRADTTTLDRFETGRIEARKLKVVISRALRDSVVPGMNFLSAFQSWHVEGRTLILVPPRKTPTGQWNRRPERSL